MFFCRSMSISVKFKNRINDLVDEVINQRNLKRSALPKLMKVDYSSLTNALEYGIIPTPRIAIRMANFFKCSIPYLLGESDDEYFLPSQKGETFENRINLLCAENNTDHTKVNKECNFNRGYLTRWVKNHYIPRWEFLDILADHFHVSIDFLLGRTDDRN